MSWSSRAGTDGDQQAVLAFFTEPDFYFRTPHPELQSEADVSDLLDGARVLLWDGKPVGLYATRPAGGPDSPYGHYTLHLRLVHDVPDERWAEAYREVVRALRWRTEVVRVTAWVGDFDERGLRILRGLGLTEEGTYHDRVFRDGGRHGLRQFAQLWPVSA